MDDSTLLIAIPIATAAVATALRNRSIHLYWIAGFAIFAAQTSAQWVTSPDAAGSASVLAFVGAPIAAAFGIRASAWLRFYALVFFAASVVAYAAAMFIAAVVAVNLGGLDP